MQVNAVQVNTVVVAPACRYLCFVAIACRCLLPLVVAPASRCLCFVACTPDFYDVHLVSSGCSDLLAEVFGDPAGIGGRATIGVQSLCDRMCFETWAEVEIA